MQVFEAVERTLTDYGVDAVFGVAGDGNLFFVETLIRHESVQYVSSSHEAGAILMADGYARATGNLGVATITRGPAVTNSVTALTEATRNRTPMLLVAGDTVFARRGHMQDIDQRSVLLPTGAGFEQLRSGETAIRDLAVAIQRARLEERPIVLNVPEDVFDEVASEKPHIPPPRARQAFGPSTDAMDTSLGILVSSKRPIILAGRGAVRAGSRSALISLADRIGAPLMTTLLAKDYFDGHPLNLDICGTLSSPLTAELIGQSDCIVAFGASLNEMTTARGRYLDGKAVIQCDADAGRIGTWSSVTDAVVGDARMSAEAMLLWLDELGYEAPTGWSANVAAQLRDAPNQIGVCDPSDDDSIDPISFTRRLNSVLPSDRTLVVDGGRCMTAPFKYLRVRDPADLLVAVNFGSIGLAMGEAIGAGVGRPDRPVVAAMGDGGFMLGGLAEFNTAVRHGVDLIVIVYNDNCYGSEHTKLRGRGADVKMSMMDWPDLAPVADALGGTGVTIREPDDMDQMQEAIVKRDRPLLFDVKLSPEVTALLRS